MRSARRRCDLNRLEIPVRGMASALCASGPRDWDAAIQCRSTRRWARRTGFWRNKLSRRSGRGFRGFYSYRKLGVSVTKYPDSRMRFASFLLGVASLGSVWAQLPQAAWEGEVDGRVEITVRGDRMETREISGPMTNGLKYRVYDALPARSAQVRLQTQQGRGTIRISQQPSASNNYAAVITVEDPQGGRSFYAFQDAVFMRSNFSGKPADFRRHPRHPLAAMTPAATTTAEDVATPSSTTAIRATTRGRTTTTTTAGLCSQVADLRVPRLPARSADAATAASASSICAGPARSTMK